MPSVRSQPDAGQRAQPTQRAVASPAARTVTEDKRSAPLVSYRNFSGQLGADANDD